MTHRFLLSSAGWLLGFALLAPPWAQAQSCGDVVYLTNGSVVQGTVLELVTGQQVAIETALGNRFVFAMDEVERIERDANCQQVGIRPPGLERWYTYWALGGNSLRYPTELDQALDVLDDFADAQLSLDFDFLGFYFPLRNHKTILGGIINAGADRYQFDDEWLQLNQYLYGASVMHFLTGYIGRGVFIRGDLGFARFVVASSGPTTVTAGNTGFGLLFGGGYAFPITRGTRLLINLNYTNKQIEGESLGKLSLSIGGLF